METLPERLDWLWFLGYNLDTPIPDHSVLSKARRRWGEEAFRIFFEGIVIQCVEKSLVDGTKIFMDASFIDADASNNSVADTKALKTQLNERYRELKERLTEKESAYSEVNTRFISATDPDASIVRQGGRAKLRHKTHRAVDGANAEPDSLLPVLAPEFVRGPGGLPGELLRRRDMEHGAAVVFVASACLLRHRGRRVSAPARRHGGFRLDCRVEPFFLFPDNDLCSLVLHVPEVFSVFRVDLSASALEKGSDDDGIDVGRTVSALE